jgi:hypothetical protein
MQLRPPTGNYSPPQMSCIGMIEKGTLICLHDEAFLKNVSREGFLTEKQQSRHVRRTNALRSPWKLVFVISIKTVS